MSRCLLSEPMVRGARRAKSFVREGRICRALAVPDVEFYREMLGGRLYASLLDAGLIETREITPPPDGFDLCVEQESCVCVAPARCWPGAMLRDAALFYLQFARRAAAWGIGLRRADYDVMRIGHDLRPRYTDFASLAPLGWTGGEVPPIFNSAMLDPLYQMREGRHEEARRGIARTRGDDEGHTELLNASQDGRRPIRSQVYLDARRREYALRRHGRFFDLLIAYQREIECFDFSDATQPDEPLTAFEPDVSWRPRDCVLHELLRRTRWQTVLDVGCAEGWASVVAARFGKRVIALESNDHAMSRLYRLAVRERLAILPLVCDVARLMDTEPATDRESAGRFRSDVVLACGILPRLLFECGRTLEQVVTVLTQMTRRMLVVEYADAGDETIRRRTVSGVPGWYCFDNVRRELARCFRRIDVLPGSFGPERRLLICSERMADVSVRRQLEGSTACI